MYAEAWTDKVSHSQRQGNHTQNKNVAETTQASYYTILATAKWTTFFFLHKNQYLLVQSKNG